MSKNSTKNMLTKNVAQNVKAPKSALAPKTVKAPRVEGAKKEAPPIAPTVETQAAPPVVAPPKVTVVRDAFGNRLVTRAHAINAVLARATSALTLNQIETSVHASEEGRAYARENNKQVGAIRNHLIALKKLNLVTVEKGAWRSIEGATKQTELERRAAELKALEAQRVAEEKKNAK